MRQYVLEPPKETPQKRKKHPKLETFSTRKQTQRTQEGKVKQLSVILKNAMATLQANGITTQSSPYPLAIADINGEMRKSQKKNTFSPESSLSHERIFSAFCQQSSHFLDLIL